MADSTIWPAEVEIINGLPESWPVTCAWVRLSRDPDVIEMKGQARRLLASELWGARVDRRVGPVDRSGGLPAGMQITHDSMGKPHLLVGLSEGPGISYSYLGRTMWAAMCDERHHCGIDAAGISEFGEDYPFHRAFRDGELEGLRAVTCESASEAAALLWSAKEALVKALGCGFHLVDPCCVEVSYRRACGEALFMEAAVYKRILTRRLPSLPGETRLIAFRRGEAWISIALASREPLPTYGLIAMKEYGEVTEGWFPPKG